MVLGGLVIGLYFKYGGVHSAFEAAGAFAVLMIAIYYFAQIFLLVLWLLEYMLKRLVRSVNRSKIR
jgi:hypothetical protein